MALIKPDQGSIWVDGDDITRLKPAGVSRTRRKMGFLFQDAALFDSLTLYDNLALPLRRLTQKTTEEIDFAIDELLLSQKREKKMTVLVVTHDVHGARRVGDQFVVLHKGNLIAHGTASEIESSGDETARKLISEDYPA